jgi:hypothetical protein
MSFPDYKGYNADQILGNRYVPDSSWHIQMALGWCDYAERTGIWETLHYAGLHLRTGIEHLWFEVLFVAQGGVMSPADYVESLRNTTKLYKFIDQRSPSYYQFAKFTEILAIWDSVRHPPAIVWDIGRLKRIHGECSGKLLHFQGVPDRGYPSEQWTQERMRFVYDSARWIFDLMQARGNLVVYFPDGLSKPEVFEIWEKFRDGTLSEEDAAMRLRIIQPVLRMRKRGLR